MRREPIIERLKPDERGRVLDRKRIWQFYLLLLPVFLPISVMAIGAFLAWGLGEVWEVPGFFLVGLGVVLFIGYCIYESFFIGFYPARCYLRWLRERIDRRPDAIVKSGNPDAFFVQMIPRENWTVSMGENAGDVGLLVVDRDRDELRYEGDLERWTVPGDCIRSFRLESFTPPGGLPAMNQFTVVVLVVDVEDGDTWESPLACHPVHFEMWTPRKRVRGAELLRRSIGNLVDPDKWSPVPDEELWPLRPPPTKPEAADYGETGER
ncbi:MAG TPA: hypothetical protein VKD71_12005 [Gemmataceae bacterium]|nr:hypothetical protein [Gemmataceae bacterium]